MPTFDVDTCSWLQYRDTFEALIVKNAAVPNVQKFHCLIASLKLEPKDLISNLQITNEDFIVARQLFTQRYNNKELIAMRPSKHLRKMPHVIKRDASSLRKLMKYVSSHMNALQALSLNVYVQDLILNNLMPATIDPESQREWEFFTATRTFTSTTEVIVTFLESRLRALQRIHITQAKKLALVTSLSSHPSGSKVIIPSYSNVAT